MYEEFGAGVTFRSRLGRTITETDNIWFTGLTMNANQIHFNVPYAGRTQFGQPIVNSGFTLALITGMTVPTRARTRPPIWPGRTSGLPKPVFVDDTLWAQSVDLRESRSSPSVGIISMRYRGINHRREVVIEFKRTFMVDKRSAPEAAPTFPATDTEWSV